MIIKNINLGKNNFIFLLFILFSQSQTFPVNAEEEIYFGNFVDIKILDKLSSKNKSIKINVGEEYIFKNLALIHSATFPVGINHITKDISKVCSLTLEEAENIKNEIDFSFRNNEKLFDEKGYLKNFYFKNSTFRKISQTMILNVTKARIDEILQMITITKPFSYF